MPFYSFSGVTKHVFFFLFFCFFFNSKLKSNNVNLKCLSKQRRRNTRCKTRTTSNRSYFHFRMTEQQRAKLVKIAFGEIKPPADSYNRIYSKRMLFENK